MKIDGKLQRLTMPVASLRYLAPLLGLSLLCCEKKDEPPPPSTSAPAAASAPPLVDAAPVPEPESERAASIVILAGGDVNLGRGAGQRILKDPTYNPLREMVPLLATADFRHVNLESQLSDQGGETQSKNNHLVFTGPPGGADSLALAGIDLVSLANNHAWDYGKKALFETFDNLERAKVGYVGASREVGKQYEPVVVNIKGWSVAWFAVTHIWNQGHIEKHPGRHHVAWASFDHLGKRLKAARKKHDLVLVSYHGGGEYIEIPMQWTRDFFRAVMATGADAIFGHHPHVPHGIGFTGDRPAFYSLGNLVFAMHSDHPWTGTSFFARLTFRKDAPPQVEACPYHILGHIPMPFEGKTQPARERALRHHLRQISRTTGGAEVGEPGAMSCMEITPRKRRVSPAQVPKTPG